MRIVVTTIFLLLSPMLMASDECSFDQEYQVSLLTAVAHSEPGATLNLERRQVSWGDAGSGMTIFAFGGCEDLGSTVTRSTPLASPRTQEQVFSLAKELAERFWSNKEVAVGSAAEILLTGLSARKYEIEQIDGSTIYRVSDEGYVELYVEHAYVDGIDSVTIAWQGNF